MKWNYLVPTPNQHLIFKWTFYPWESLDEILIVWSFSSKTLEDGTGSATFKIYVFVISAYVGIKIIISLLMSVPCCHGVAEACYSWSAVRLVKWMHQVLSIFSTFWLIFSNLCKWCFLLRISDIFFCWRRIIMLEEACMRVPLTISSNYRTLKHNSVIQFTNWKFVIIYYFYCADTPLSGL